MPSGENVNGDRLGAEYRNAFGMHQMHFPHPSGREQERPFALIVPHRTWTFVVGL
ncbi:MAG: hypothetical protein AVDCRST_MAG93-1988 [uncultured Chloroflexia bacterium]|uniref:Uncharacterized protein n=1 Tax=uncultured Chloroflexia bacterium TaxID=1672391 RepID=A0A6J4IPZ7_9CHLR|nr:MAG: hypothetical protein AVDCRST_MAG93-1988 [uncultured Chloroflexia bacterium]